MRTGRTVRLPSTFKFQDAVGDHVQRLSEPSQTRHVPGLRLVPPLGVMRNWRTAGRAWLRVLLFGATTLPLAFPPRLEATAGSQTGAVAQEPLETEAEAMAALRGAADMRHQALWYAERVGWRASDEFKAAVIDVAWQYMSGELPEPEWGHEGMFDYITAVIRTHDPAAIPLLVEYAIGSGNIPVYALADFGAAAVPALLDFVRPDRQRPPGSWDSSIAAALRALRLILNDGLVTSEMRPHVIETARIRLSKGPQRWTVIESALALAVALGDPELISAVNRLAVDADAMAALLGPEQIREHEEQGIPSPGPEVQASARDMLAGVHTFPGRIRCPLGDCPPR